jgi:5-hydroxyisourate hydrolase-like protein (transthyretin family)
VARPIIARSSLNNTGLQIIGSTLRSGACVKFTYALPAVENVSLRLYSLNGQLQSELVNKHQSGGNYSLTMQRGNLAAGAYLVVFKADDVYQEKMISLMK